MKQVEQLAFSVNHKLQTDLNTFNSQYDESSMQVVAPPNPEVFCSGSIINGFTPTNKRETDSLCMSIKHL